ncbi:transporter [Micromonospora rosaria]|uniref:Transporter n=1 Tax=Micromonospora rosaria TaxID=47874 RepID=A0A136PUD5_9ACTN|nr:RDD family protein [Micromonospora rosaria]KXK61967.1 transporter [Micromonospora rosaria]
MTTPQPPAPPAADQSFTPPSLGRRFGALMIDWILCLLVSFLFADPTRDAWSTVAVLIAEYTFFLGLFAQTPGMYLNKIACVSYTDGGRIGVFRALLRGVLLALVVPALVMDGDRRGLHDRLANSVIVSAPRRKAARP